MIVLGNDGLVLGLYMSILVNILFTKFHFTQLVLIEMYDTNPHISFK